MKTIVKAASLIPFALLLGSGAIASAWAQTDSWPPYEGSALARPAIPRQQLEQLLAPVALYPDALLSQILMASTYPLDIVQAARWSRAYPGLSGDAAVRAAQDNGWDPSVMSLTAFPQVLDMMDQRLDWTRQLGDAFLAQQAQVMDSVQELRRRAYLAGNLRSNEQIQVLQSGPGYVLEPTDPGLVYLPYYDPGTVYGPWAQLAYPPAYWAPLATRYYPRPGMRGGIWFGSGVALSAGFFFGDFDWGRRRVEVVNVNPYYYRNGRGATRNTTIVNNTFVNGNNGRVSAAGQAAAAQGPGAWRHDAAPRQGEPYRDPMARQQFVNAAPLAISRQGWRETAAAAPTTPRTDDGQRGRDHRAEQVYSNPSARVQAPAPQSSPAPVSAERPAAVQRVPTDQPERGRYAQPPLPERRGDAEARRPQIGSAGARGDESQARFARPWPAPHPAPVTMQVAAPRPVAIAAPSVPRPVVAITPAPAPQPASPPAQAARPAQAAGPQAQNRQANRGDDRRH